MWSVRILTGPQAGKYFDLKVGRNFVGRGPHCEVHLFSQGVSKEHCEIHVYQDKIMVVDLKSSNGTFVNGVRVQNSIVKLGDKISIHDILIDILPKSEVQSPRPPVVSHTQTQMGQPQFPNMPTGMSQGNAAYAMSPELLATHSPGTAPEYRPHQMAQPQAPAAPVSSFFKSQMSHFQAYLERVALPGVYKLASLTDFKTVIAGFIILFIFSVTILSMFPMMQITKESITVESMRRASSLARSVGLANQQAYMDKNRRALSTHTVETEDGVKQAFIVEQMDGSIIAPASREGTTSNLTFVIRARKEMKALTEQIDANTIAASYPIGMYDPNTGEPIVKAYAIVLYDISSLSFDSGRSISLFMQTLVIASVVGFFVFFLMYSLIEFPIRELNDKLDIAMRDKTDDIRISIVFPVFQQLVGNVNSLLTRSNSGNQENQPANQSKDAEAENLVRLMMLPCVALTNQGFVISCNPRFEQFARNTSAQMQGQSLSTIGDASLKQNLEFLTQKCRDNPFAIHSDNLEFSGQACVIQCQAFATNSNIDYFIVVISPVEGGSE